MGSLEEAQMAGFMCRLCSSINKKVVHVFSLDELDMLRQIYVTVEIKILPDDDLPKTICEKCKSAVQKNYNFIKMVRRNFKMGRRKKRPLHPPENPALEKRQRLNP